MAIPKGYKAACGVMSPPGRTMSKAPINPKPTKNQRMGVTYSFMKMRAKIVTIKGVTIAMAVNSATGTCSKLLKPRKLQDRSNKALKTCSLKTWVEKSCKPSLKSMSVVMARAWIMYLDHKAMTNGVPTKINLLVVSITAMNPMAAMLSKIPWLEMDCALTGCGALGAPIRV